MQVPLLDLRAQFGPVRDDVMAAVTRVCDSQQFILGPEVEALERELAAMLAVKHAIGVSSGTDALLVAMMALDIGEGDEVVTPTYSFFATAGSVARLGARPVLVDIDPRTFNLDVEATIAAMSPRTRAVIPVHLFGQSADLDPIVEAARARNIAVVEDAAQAIGSRYRGRTVGSIADLGCFSFFPSKNLGAFGDGGLVTTNDDDLATKVRLLRGHGMHPKYFHRMIGGNFRLDALQAAVLRVKAPHLSQWTTARRANADRYRRLLEPAPPSAGLVLPVEVEGNYHIYNQFVIRVRDRDGLRQHLTGAGIGTEIYYPVPFHLQECFASLGYQRGAFPVAEAAADDSLALPVYGELSDDQLQYVAGEIIRYYAR